MRAHFILVGLLYFCGLSISQECRPELLENVDFQGDAIKSLYAPDVEHCQRLCTQHPSCLFFSFVPSDSTDEMRHFYCYLKTSSSRQPTEQPTRQGFTSGFSLKPCNTDITPPESCPPPVYHGVEFYGAAHKTLFTADYEECQRACTNDPTCQFFTFNNEDFTTPKYRYKCHLKFSLTVPTPFKVQAKAGLVSGFSKNLQMAQQSDTACQTTFFPNTDIQGHDIENMPAASPAHCSALCSAYPQCTYFSYHRTAFECHLKSNSQEMVLKPNSILTSGIPAHSCQPDNTWVEMTYVGVDFLGSDYHNVPADDADACQRACTEDHNCQFYTYVTDSFSTATLRHICYLKRVITMPAPPGVAKVANVVSGFSMKNCVFFMECARSGRKIYVGSQ